MSFQSRPWLPLFHQYNASLILSYHKPNQSTSICMYKAVKIIFEGAINIRLILFQLN